MKAVRVRPVPEMVMRVAKILATQPGLGRARWDDLPATIVAARAVIEGMREPTETMALVFIMDSSLRDNAAETWRQMIDMALAEGDLP